MNPWKNFAQAVCLPNNCQCEGVRDSFVRQPSSTWSSLAYVLAGLAIFRYVKDKSMDLTVWTIVCVVMGFSSLIGHMSYIRSTLAMDFASIALVMSFFGVWNLLTLLKQSHKRILIYFILYYAVLTLIMYSLNKYAKIGTVFLIFVFAMGDVIREIGWRFIKARTLQYSLLTFSISFGIYMMDELHLYCDPNSLFQWHSVWHFGTAFSMFLYGKWRFDEKGFVNLNLVGSFPAS